VDLTGTLTPTGVGALVTALAEVFDASLEIGNAVLRKGIATNSEEPLSTSTPSINPSVDRHSVFFLPFCSHCYGFLTLAQQGKPYFFGPSFVLAACLSLLLFVSSMSADRDTLALRISPPHAD